MLSSSIYGASNFFGANLDRPEPQGRHFRYIGPRALQEQWSCSKKFLLVLNFIKYTYNLSI